MKKLMASKVMPKMYFNFLCILFLSFAANSLQGCSKDPVSTISSYVPPADTVSNKTVVKYLALGDSYTIGQNVLSTQRFPYLTMVGLKALGINVREPDYIATTGWTTADLQSAISSINPPSDYDIVTLLIGVNDQFQHKDTAGYRIRFTSLLQKSISLAANRKDHVFVLSIPDYSATPFVPASSKSTVSMEVDWFNTINRQVTTQAGIVYIDITPLTREAATDPTLLTNDNLHYSAKEHQKWADVLVPRVMNVLH